MAEQMPANGPGTPPWAAWMAPFLDKSAPNFANGPWGLAFDYAVDAMQRTILYWDVMRQRGNQYLESQAKTAPHVLSFAHELIMDGRRLPQPVNYGLVKVLAKDDTPVDPKKRPFVIVDPRAGHGPGIGGFKADSEIGVAMRAGHPCYFIGFTPHPQPSQTLPDVLTAIGTFLKKVHELHPESDGKPTVIGNCQAGWAIMMIAAIRPELFGPILVAGSPLSYWAGVRGVNPMRYTGGMLGGSWLAAMTSDLGNGIFDGAWLVQNFEGLNPANTLWTKQYDLYSRIDTEGPRYLGFEKWWGGHVLLTGAEMQYIVDNLFVGNKLATGEIKTQDGVPIDLRAIRGPIIVFCSHGDNITPPQQALGWILDLYKDVDEIRAHGQTIVYTIHKTVGHLGIFVSGGVAKKEHDEFASNIDLIDLLPPGLYEGVFTEKPTGSAGETVLGGYVASFEPRTLDDIRALGGNDIEDERRFAAVARLSEITRATYERYGAPAVRALTTDQIADAMRNWHPLRLQYEMFSDRNPFMKPIAQMADAVRANRRPIEKDNPFLRMQEAMSNGIEKSLDSYREARDRWTEQAFLAFYGSPAVQSLVGLGASDQPPRARPGDPADRVAAVQQRVQELKGRIKSGGVREGALRAMIYCAMQDATFDERSFAALKHVREQVGDNLPLAEFKEVAREQYYMMLLDEPAALAAIPDLIGRGSEAAQRLGPALRRILTAKGPLSPAREARLARVEALVSAGPDRKQEIPRSVA